MNGEYLPIVSQRQVHWCLLVNSDSVAPGGSLKFRGDKLATKLRDCDNVHDKHFPSSLIHVTKPG